jgi:hypothetical protein
MRPRHDRARPTRRNGEVNFRGQKRSNATHQSATDPRGPALSQRQGQAAQVCFMDHALMENQRKRKQIEEPFSWANTVGQLRKTMLRGLARRHW